MSGRMVFVVRDLAIRARLVAHILGLDMQECWEVSIARHDPARSGEQNALAWLVVSAIAEQVSVDGAMFSKEAWWTYFKREAFGVSVVALPDGSLVDAETSSRGRGKRAFSAFMEIIMKCAAENNVVLPDEAAEYRRGMHG